MTEDIIGSTRATTLPEDAKARKQYPLASGVLDYFADALVAISHVSWRGNEQHNPGQPLHWARNKSADQADTIIRHFLQRGSLDSDGIRHSAKMAWRALALLQLEIEVEQQQRILVQGLTHREHPAVADMLAEGKWKHPEWTPALQSPPEDCYGTKEIPSCSTCLYGRTCHTPERLR